MNKTIKQDLKVGDSVSLDNGRIVITMLKKSGQVARLDIRAGDDVTVQLHKAATNASSIAQKGLTTQQSAL